MELKEVTVELAKQLRLCWEEQLESLDTEKPATHYKKILDWADRFARGESDENVYVYVLVNGDSVDAVLEISHALPRSPEPWLKVLQIHVSPKWDIAESDGEAIPVRELSEIASTALVESLSLTYEKHPSVTLKVWGTTPLTAEFLEGIIAGLERTPGMDGFKVYRHGNWLVIEKGAKSAVAKLVR